MMGMNLSLWSLRKKSANIPLLYQQNVEHISVLVVTFFNDGEQTLSQ